MNKKKGLYYYAPFFNLLITIYNAFYNFISSSCLSKK